jgi:hypothetical protein
MKARLLIRVLVSTASLMTAAPEARAGVITWDGSSGQFPDELSPPFALFDTATTDPVLSGGTLTLSTSLAGAGDILGYRQSGSELEIPALLQIEARLRFISGSSIVNYRAPVGIQFATEPNVVNFLWIEHDVIFLNGPGDTRGPSAAVDTDGDFHTYKIEVAGTGLGSPISVFYDNATTPILTGALFSLPTAFTDIAWGDLSEATAGVSEWQHFQHNALAAPVPEPNSMALWLIGLSLMAVAAWRKRGHASFR